MEKKQPRFKLSFFAIARLGEVDIKLQLGKPRKTFSKFLANYVQLFSLGLGHYSKNTVF